MTVDVKYRCFKKNAGIIMWLWFNVIQMNIFPAGISQDKFWFWYKLAFII